MQPRVLRKMGYENTFIYIFQYGTIFQYLFSWQHEIYQQNRTFTPSLWRRLGTILKKPLYSQFMLEQIEAIMISGAMSSIDLLKTQPKMPTGKKAFSKAIRAAGECMWRASEKGYYTCIVHGKTVEMIDGKRPKHE